MWGPLLDRLNVVAEAVSPGTKPPDCEGLPTAQLQGILGKVMSG